MGRKFVHWLLGDDPRKWLEPVNSPNPDDEIPRFHIEFVDKFGIKFHNGVPPGQLPEPDDKLYVITKEPFHQIMVLDKKGGEHWFINNYKWTKADTKHEKEFVLSRMKPSDMFKESEKASELRRKDAIARGKGKEPKPRAPKNIIVLGRQRFPRICVICLDGLDVWVDTASDDPDLLLVARKHRAVMRGLEEFIGKMTQDELEDYTEKWVKRMETHGVAIVTKEDLDRVKVKTSTKANTPVKSEGSQKEAAEQRAVEALANAIVHSQPAGKVYVKSAARPEHQRKEKETARAKTPVPGHQQTEKKKVAAKPQVFPAPPPLPPKIPPNQPGGAQNGKRVARIDPSVLSPEPRALRPQKSTMMVPTKQPAPTRAASPLPRSSTPYPEEDSFDDDHMENALSLNRSTPIPRSVSAGGPPQAPGYGPAYQPPPQYPHPQAAVFQSLYIPHMQQQAAQAAVYRALYRQPPPQQPLPVGTRHDRAVTPLPAPQPVRPFAPRAVSETQYLSPDSIPASQPPTQRIEGDPEWKKDANRATGGDRAKTPQPSTSLKIPSIKVSSPASPRQKSPAPVSRKPAPARSPSPAPPARNDRQRLPSQKTRASPSSSAQTQKTLPSQTAKARPSSPGQTQKTKPAQQQPAQNTVQKPVQKQQQPAQKLVQQEKPAPKVVTQQQSVSQQKPAQKPAQAQQQKAVQQPAQQQKSVQAQQKTAAQVQQKPAPAQRKTTAQAQQKTTTQVQQTPVQQQKKPVQTPVQQPAQQQKPAAQVQQKSTEKKPAQQQSVKQSAQQPAQQQKTASPAQLKPIEKKPVQQQKATSPAQQKPVEKKPAEEPVQQKPAQPAQSVEKKPAQPVQHQKTASQSQQKPVEKKPVQPAQQQKTASQSQQKSAEKKPAQHQKTPSQVQQQSSPATVVRKPAASPAPAPPPSPAPTAASVSAKKTSGAAAPRKPVAGAIPPPPPSPSIISSASSSPPRLSRAPRPPGWDQIPVWNGPNGSRANSVVAGGSEVGSVRSGAAPPPSMRQASSVSRASMLSAAITAAVSAAVNAVAGATGGYGDDLNSAQPNEYPPQSHTQQQGAQVQYHQGQGQGDPYQGGHMPGSWAFSPTVGNAEMTSGRFANNQRQQQPPAGAGHVCNDDCRRSGCPSVVGDNAAFMFGTGYRPRDSRDSRAPR